MADSKDAPPAELRDALMIWTFATYNSDTLEGIISGTITPPVLQQKLEDLGFIRKGNQNNKNTCEDVVTDIQADKNKYRTVQQGLASVRALAGFWTGSTQHPRPVELNNVLNVNVPPA